MKLKQIRKQLGEKRWVLSMSEFADQVAEYWPKLKTPSEGDEK